MFLYLIDGLSRYTAVERHEIHPVLRMKTDNIDEISGRQCRQVALIVYHAVIDRYCPYHDRAFGSKLSPERLSVSVTGKIHDSLGSHVDSAHDLFHLYVVVLAVSGNSEVHIYLRSEHAPDAFGIQACMPFVGAYGYFPFGYQFLQLFHRHVFLFRDSFQLRCDDAFSRGIHLSSVVHHYLPSQFSYVDIWKKRTRRGMYASVYRHIRMMCETHLHIPTLALSTSGSWVEAPASSQPVPQAPR